MSDEQILNAAVKELYTALEQSKIADLDKNDFMKFFKNLTVKSVTKKYKKHFKQLKELLNVENEEYDKYEISKLCKILVQCNKIKLYINLLKYHLELEIDDKEAFINTINSLSNYLDDNDKIIIDELTNYINIDDYELSSEIIRKLNNLYNSNDNDDNSIKFIIFKLLSYINQISDDATNVDATNVENSNDADGMDLCEINNMFSELTDKGFIDEKDSKFLDNLLMLM